MVVVGAHGARVVQPVDKGEGDPPLEAHVDAPRADDVDDGLDAVLAQRPQQRVVGAGVAANVVAAVRIDRDQAKRQAETIIVSAIRTVERPL